MPELKLLPCPFCGGEAGLSSSRKMDGFNTYVITTIRCYNCGASTRSYITDGYYDCKDTVVDCITAWNTRADHIADINKMVCWCKDCKHYSEYEGVCTNADSEWVADFRSQYDSCKNCELKCHDDDTIN